MSTEQKLTCKKPVVQAIGFTVLVKRFTISAIDTGIIGLYGKKIVQGKDRIYYIVVSIGEQAKKERPELEIGLSITIPLAMTDKKGQYGLIEPELQYIYDESANDFYAILDFMQIYAIDPSMKDKFEFEKVTK